MRSVTATAEASHSDAYHGASFAMKFVVACALGKMTALTMRRGGGCEAHKNAKQDIALND